MLGARRTKPMFLHKFHEETSVEEITDSGFDLSLAPCELTIRHNTDEGVYQITALRMSIVFTAQVQGNQIGMPLQVPALPSVAETLDWA